MIGDRALFYLLALIINRTDGKYNDIYSDRLRLFILQHILRKAARLDVATYDDPEFYNRIEKLHEELEWKAYSLYETTYEILGSVTSLVATIGLFLLLPTWIITLLIAAALPMFWFQTQYGVALHKINNDYREPTRRANYFSWQLIQRREIKDVKLLDLEDTYIKGVTDVWQAYIQSLEKTAKRFLLLEVSTGTLGLLVRLAIMVWLAWSTVTRVLTIGQFTLYGNLIGQLGGSITGLLYGLARLTRFRQFLSYLNDFEQRKAQITEPVAPKKLALNRPGLIRFEDVSFRYPSQERGWILRHISFEIKPGQHLALVGENGAGKTTIVKLLARFYDPTEGKITINGTDLRDFKTRDLHRFLGIIFQDFAQLQERVQENISYGNIRRPSTKTNIESAGKQSGAHDFITQLPDQYQTMLAREFDKGTELSGGQWQKIALARTFFRQARLLILDEPTAALDAAAEEHFYKQFLKLKKDTSAVLISHRFSTVRMADQILVIENGRIKESGSHAELIKLNGRYAQLFQLQADRYK